MTRLGITKNAALTLLNALRAEGAVLRVGSRYYPADAVTPPDAQPAAVLAFLRENGPAARKAIAARLGLPPAQTAALLPYSECAAPGLAVIGDFARHGEVFFAVPLLLCELGRCAALACVLLLPVTHSYGVLRLGQEADRPAHRQQ